MQSTTILFFLYAIHSVALKELKESECPKDIIVAYKLKFYGTWSRSVFLKEYPSDAKWSEMVVQTHSINYHLFKENEVAAEGFRMFVKDNDPRTLMKSGSDNRFVFDQILDPGIANGIGSTEQVFYVNKLFNAVSLARALIPTSDWFVGADSIDLCPSATWIERLDLHLKLYDAGAAEGSTFYIAFNDTFPPKTVKVIDFMDPSSGLFYYPDLEPDTMSSLAGIEITKVQEYLMTPERQIKIYDEIKAEIVPSGIEDSTRTLYSVLDVVQTLASEIILPKNLRSTAYVRGSKDNDCLVSEWSNSTDCMAACGVGTMYRKRYVLRRNKGDGLECSILYEIKLCSTTKYCRNN